MFPCVFTTITRDAKTDAKMITCFSCERKIVFNRNENNGDEKKLTIK